MSQAILNIHSCNYKKDFFYRLIKKIHPLEILFFLSILLIMLINSWVLLDWMENAQCLSLSKLVIIGERHHTSYNDICRSILAPDSSLRISIRRDVNIIQRQIKCLPWVKQVNVKKQWPDKLKIHLTEYVPIAFWNDQYLIDLDGDYFSIPSEFRNIKTLPRLYGPKDNSDEVLQSFLKIEQILSKNCFSLKNTSVSTRYSWQLTLTNGIKLNLGSSNVLDRLLRFIALYPVLKQQEKNNNKRINYVDLRYDSGAAVGWKSNIVNKLN